MAAGHGGDSPPFRRVNRTDGVDDVNEIFVTVSGNVVGEPQARHTKAEVPFVTFRVASNVRRIDPKSGDYVDVATNYVNVTAFRTLGINLANSLHKGDPVVVYGRMRVNQWVNGDRQGTTVEIDAYNAGFDMNRGEGTFERVARPQLRNADRLSDPVVQETSQTLEGGADESGHEDGSNDGEDSMVETVHAGPVAAPYRRPDSLSA